jgi:hypothetical protein
MMGIDMQLPPSGANGPWKPTMAPAIANSRRAGVPEVVNNTSDGGGRAPEKTSANKP